MFNSDGSIIQRPELGDGATVLDIPIHDLASGQIYNSITHCDVLYFKDGWNGYKYWMVATPYPDFTREQPCIYASHNGTNWVVPSGLVNPVVSRAEAVAVYGGNAFTPDPDLMFANGTLYLFYLRFSTALDFQLCRRSSTSGVKWSDPVITLTGSTPGIISPAFIYEGGTNVTMFYVKGLAAGTPTLQYRTSADLGLSWGVEQNVTAPKCTDLKPDFWHIDVIKVSGKYHALVLSKVTGESFLWYYTSLDKATWNLECNTPAIPYSGNGTYDGLGNYRSSFVGKDGGRFDLWIVGQPRGATADDVNYWPDLAVTCTSASPCVVTSTGGAHYWNTDDTFQFVGGTAPTGASLNTTYYVKRVGNTTFQFAATKGGASINTSSTGTSVRASRNPWRITMYRNVSLPLRPEILACRTAITNINSGGSHILPPANCINAALAAWPVANLGFAQRFRVETATECRYIRYPCSAAGVGNIEVGVLRTVGQDQSSVTPLITSGVIAAPAPTAGSCRVDLGKFVLQPGEYWLWMWSDSAAGPTVPAAALGYGGTWNVAQASLVASGGKAMPVTGQALDMTGGRAISHMMIEGDYA